MPRIDADRPGPYTADPMAKATTEPEETNALADSLAKAPDFLRAHGLKIALGTALVAALVVFFAQRTSTARQQQETAAANLAGARDGLTQLRQLALAPLPDEQFADQRDQIAGTVRQALDAALADADTPARKADALAARADLSWAMAALPTPAGATTRPALAPRQTRDESLDAAAKDWGLVLSEFPGQPGPAADARFGLAAVAEDRGEFDRAAEHYQAVVDDGSALKMHRDLAADRLAALPDLRRPVRFGTPGPRDQGPLAPGVLDGTGATPSPEPASEPASQPATQPASQPATQPVP